jgi:hypothetical protein
VDGTALTDISGYRILYGASANALTNSVNVTGASTTSYSIGGLTSGATYYFALVTLNSAGTASAASTPAAATVK